MRRRKSAPADLGWTRALITYLDASTDAAKCAYNGNIQKTISILKRTASDQHRLLLAEPYLDRILSHPDECKSKLLYDLQCTELQKTKLK